MCVREEGMHRLVYISEILYFVYVYHFFLKMSKVSFLGRAISAPLNFF